MAEKKNGTHRARVGKVTPEHIEEAVEAVRKGITLTAHCRTPGTPGRSTLLHHIRNDLVLRTRYEEARDDGYDVIADEVLEIVDEKPTDNVEVQSQKLRAETRLRLLSKWCSGRYGDKLQLGGDGGHAIKMGDGDVATELRRILGGALSRKLADSANRINGHTTDS